MTSGSVMLFRTLFRNGSRGETGSISSSSKISLQPTRQPMKGAASGVRAERGAGGGRVTCLLFYTISTISRYRKTGKAQLSPLPGLDDFLGSLCPLPTPGVEGIVHRILQHDLPVVIPSVKDGEPLRYRLQASPLRTGIDV